MLRRRLTKQRKPNNEKTEILDFNKPSYSFIPKGHHEWRQRGPYLVCVSCELQHAVWIGVEKLMVGLNKKSQPILKKRKDLKNLY